MEREYMDEKIRYIINQVEELEEFNSQNIYKGVNINGKHYEFSEMGFFEDTLKLQIPVDFVDMPDELAALKYPSSNRPPIIRTDETGDMNITLNLIQNNNIEEDQDIVAVKDNAKDTLQQVNPSILFLEGGLEKVEEKTVGFLEFKSPGLSDSLYNFMFFTELNHSVMMGVFNCPYSEYPAWRPIARQIMQSLRLGNSRPDKI